MRKQQFTKEDRRYIVNGKTGRLKQGDIKSKISLETLYQQDIKQVDKEIEKVLNNNL